MARRLEQHDGLPVWSLQGACDGPWGPHADQLAFLEDSSRYRIAVCSRRAGKTVACAVDLLDTAVRVPNATCLFLGLSRNSAKGIVWEELKKLNARYALGGQANEAELVVRFKNGSRVMVSGCPTAREAERWRGYGFDLVVIDECQGFGSFLGSLIAEVIHPALLDRDGRLSLIGTPGKIKAGTFWRIWSDRGSSFSRHQWTWRENPFVLRDRTVDQILVEARAARGMPEDGSGDDAAFRREWFGSWDEDLDKVVYRWTEEANHYDDTELPDDLVTVMGIDTGHNHADAIAVLGFSYGDPKRRVFLLSEYVRDDRDRGWDELFEQIELLFYRHSPVAVVCDPAAGGAKAMIDLSNRKGIRVEAAEKQEKTEFIGILNDDLRSGRFRIKRETHAAIESSQVLWDKPDDKGRRRASAGEHSDIWDAVLYAWRRCRHYHGEEPRAARSSTDPGEHERWVLDRMEQRASQRWWQR